eukprot:gene16064-biopygen2449
MFESDFHKYTNVPMSIEWSCTPTRARGPHAEGVVVAGDGRQGLQSSGQFSSRAGSRMGNHHIARKNSAPHGLTVLRTANRGVLASPSAYFPPELNAGFPQKIPNRTRNTSATQRTRCAHMRERGSGPPGPFSRELGPDLWAARPNPDNRNREVTPAIQRESSSPHPAQYASDGTQHQQAMLLLDLSLHRGRGREAPVQDVRCPQDDLDHSLLEKLPGGGARQMRQRRSAAGRGRAGPLQPHCPPGAPLKHAGITWCNDVNGRGYVLGPFGPSRAPASSLPQAKWLSYGRHRASPSRPLAGGSFPMDWSRFALCGAPSGNLKQKKTEPGQSAEMIPDRFANVSFLFLRIFSV